LLLNIFQKKYFLNFFKNNYTPKRTLKDENFLFF
jgi:hypothetical protein